MNFDDEPSSEDFNPVQVQSHLSPDRTPAAIEHQVCSVSPHASLDDLCAAIDAADWLVARAKSIHQIATMKAIAWIDRNGPFCIGEQEFNVGYTTTIRCRNTKLCAHQLLDCLQGDLDRMLDVLIAQPFKCGTARGLLPPAAYQNLFSVKQTSKLVAGVPERVLKRGRKTFTR